MYPSIHLIRFLKRPSNVGQRELRAAAFTLNERSDFFSNLLEIDAKLGHKILTYWDMNTPWKLQEQQD